MLEYFLNAFVQGSTYFVIALLLSIAAFFIPKSVPAPKGLLKVMSGVYFVIGLIIGLTSPSVTPKLEVNYNSSHAIAEQQRLNDARAQAPREISDRTRQVRTVEERAASAVDMRQRVQDSSDEND